MSNTIIVIGNLGKDPEIRYTPDGRKVTHFTVASNVFRAGQQVTLWFNVSVWDDRFDNVLSHLSKGKLVYVVGEMSLRKWEDQNKITQTSLEITAFSIRFVPGRVDRPDQGEFEGGILRN